MQRVWLCRVWGYAEFGADETHNKATCPNCDEGELESILPEFEDFDDIEEIKGF